MGRPARTSDIFFAEGEYGARPSSELLIRRVSYITLQKQEPLDPLSQSSLPKGFRLAAAIVSNTVNAYQQTHHHNKDQPRQTAPQFDPCTKPTNIFRSPGGFMAPYNRFQMPKSAYQDEGSPQFGSFESMSTQPHSSRVDSTAYHRRRAEDSKAFLNRSPREELPDFLKPRRRKREKQPEKQELSVENLPVVAEQEEPDRGSIGFEAPKNSFNDANREVFLLPETLQNFFPSLVPPNELPDYLARPGSIPSEHEPTNHNKTLLLNEAMTVEEFNQNLDAMREFMAIVLRVAFNNLNHHWKNENAKKLYESFFPKNGDDSHDPRKSEDYSKRLKMYLDFYVYENTPGEGYNFEEGPLLQRKKQVDEEVEHNLYSGLVIMFRVLKLLRMQDSIGNTPQQRYLFTVACIMAANQSEVNIRGRPLFPKSILKALFICYNYSEVLLAEQDHHLQMGLLPFEDWCYHYQPLLIQMYNGVLSTLDYQLTVLYPVDYIEQAIPVNHPWRTKILRDCRMLTYQSDGWSQHINSALFNHPRELALMFFDKAVSDIHADYAAYTAQVAELKSMEANLRASLEWTHQQFVSVSGDEALPLKAQLDEMTTQLEEVTSQYQEIEHVLQSEAFQTCPETQEKRGVPDMFQPYEQDYVIQGILNINQLLVRDQSLAPGKDLEPRAHGQTSEVK